MSKKTQLRDLAKHTERLVDLDPSAFVPLTNRGGPSETTTLKRPTEAQQSKFDTSLDGYSALGLHRPANEAEEREFVARFVAGLKRLLSSDDNWTFIQPLLLSLENCTRCQTCAEACPVFVGSGREEAYRPTFRSEVLRRLIRRYVRPGGRLLGALSGDDLEANWATIARLGELAYRCTLCRRCAQACPIGVDNGLIAREIRKLFSQELGLAPRELHEQGSLLQSRTGASTGMRPEAFLDSVAFLEDDLAERTGIGFKWPVDRKGADILLIHNSGEYLAWPEHVQAFALVLHLAGVDYTLSSELLGYDAVNYGLWYDDVQFARTALRHIDVARRLGVNRIVIGECGHAHKALSVAADRLLPSADLLPRESYLPLLLDIVSSGRLRLDPARNDFPVTLHDPCNMVRLMGIVEPQRLILRQICPRFREMTPHGVDNYCCGGGSGFAIMEGVNFGDWRTQVAGRMKYKQILEAFADETDPSMPKYICAPCSNCKGQLRDLIDLHHATERHNLRYGGLVDLVANALADLPRPFLSWDEA